MGINESRADSIKLAGAVSLRGHSRVDIAMTTTAAQSAALTRGVYDVWCDVNVFLKVDPTANNVTAANGYLLRANTTVPFYVNQDSKIGGILASGTGTLSYHAVSWFA